MSALLISGATVTPAANDVGVGSPYRASVRLLAPGELTPMIREDGGDALIFVERGEIEMFVGSARFRLGKTRTARISAGREFAFRNPGKSDARVSMAMVGVNVQSECPTDVAA